MLKNKFLWLGVACFLLLLGGVQGGPRPSDPGPGEFKDSIRSLFEDDTNIELLASGRTLRGVVGRGETEVLGISVVEKPGVGFPDLTLTLDVMNPGADADLYCLPWSVTQQNGRMPSPRESTWKSAHAQGQDVVFVSRNDTLFDIMVMDRVTEEGDSERTSDMVCLILGHSQTETQFEVTLQLSFEQRTLAEDEKQAVKQIYSECCEDVRYCQKWTTAALEVQGGALGEMEYDLCHLRNNFCDEDGHLLRLDLSTYGLDCAFPSREIAKLSKLKKIILNSNFLTGDIGTILENLKGLSDLDELSMRGNRLTGSLGKPDSFPENGACALAQASLEILNLDENEIEGPIPSCLFESGSKLQGLFVDLNPIDSAIPDIFPIDSPLEYLSAADAGIIGTLPQSIANLDNLVSLDLRKNDLTGTIPPTFGGSAHLVSVALQSNDLSGSVPDMLATSSSIRQLNLNNNQLTQLPEAWFLQSSTSEALFQVGLSDNYFQGSFPISLAYAPSLVGLDLEGNQLSGPLPDFINSFPSAVLLDLSSNEFTGTIPSSWSSMGIMTGSAIPPFGYPGILDLSNNNLVGAVPEFLLKTLEDPMSLIWVGVNVTGNSLECVDTMEISDRLPGLESCAAIDVSPDAGSSSTPESPRNTGVSLEGTDEPSPPQAQSLSGNQVKLESTGKTTPSTSQGSAGNRGTLIAVVVSIVAVLLASVIVAVVVIKRRRMQMRARASEGVEGTADVKAMKNIEFEVFQDSV